MKVRDKIYCKKSFDLGIIRSIEVFSEGKEYTIMDIIELIDHSLSLTFKGAYIAGNTKNYLYFYFFDDCKFTNDKQLSGVKYLTDYPCFDDYFIHENRERKLKLIKLNEI